MFCERCNSALPSDGFVCTHCGALMTKSQIEIQKKLREENRKFASPSYMSEKFGAKREFKVNDNASNNYLKMVFVLLGIMVLFTVLIIISL